MGADLHAPPRRAGLEEAAMGASHRLIRRVLVIALVALAVLPASPARAGATFTFIVYVNDTYTYGFGPPNTPHTITLYAPGGAIADVAKVNTDGNGQWTVTWDVPVIRDSKIKAATATASRTLTVPRLTVRANRVTDVVSGRAPSGTALHITFGHYSSLDPTSATYYAASSTADGSGNFSSDFTAQANMVGRDYVIVSFSNSAGDTFTNGIPVPYMSVRRTSSNVTGALNIGTTATIELRTSANGLRGTASGNWGQLSDIFYSSFVNTDGDLVAVRSTNKVIGSFATDATVTIPSSTLTADASSNQATGSCMANVPFSLFVRRADYSAQTTAYGVTNGSGTFAISLGGYDVQLADKPLLSCRYPSGDIVQTGGSVVP